MAGNSELREKAWRLLWDGRWFGRLLLSAILLSLCSQFVNFVLNNMLTSLGVFSVSSLAAAIERHLGEHAPLPEFTPDLLMQLASSTVLTMFFVFIMGGIVAYGNAVMILRAADDKQENWLKAAFGGFRMPLGLAALSFRLFLVYAFWLLVSAVPSAALGWVVAAAMPSALDSGMAGKAVYAIAAVIGLLVMVAICSIPFYRYRYLFRVKADNPDWSAGRCLEECAALTDGAKWRCFMHDCSYWKILAVCGVARLVSSFAMVGVVVIAAFYIGIGQSLLYREMTAIRNCGGL